MLALLVARGGPRVILDLGLAAGWATTRARCSRSTTSARRAARRRRALRRPARALRARPARGRLGDRRRPAALALVGERAGRAVSPDGLDARRTAGALFGETLDLARRLGIDTGRGARQRPQAAVRGRRDRDDAAVRRADVRRGGRADLGIIGKDVLAEQSERAVFELLDLGYGAVPHGARDHARATTRPPRRCAGSASCASRRSTRRSPRATSSAPVARRRSSRSRARSSWRRSPASPRRSST